MFRIGDHKVIKGFENGVIGMKKGDKKTVQINKEEAYGVRDEKLVVGIPKGQLGDLPKKINIRPGMSFQLKDKVGNVILATVKEVKDDSVTLDLNHPLAGKDITFDLEMVEVLRKN